MQCAYVTLVNSTEFNYTDAGVCNQPSGLPSTMAASVVSSMSSREWGIFSYYNRHKWTGPKLQDGAEYNRLLIKQHRLLSGMALRQQTHHEPG